MVYGLVHHLSAMSGGIVDPSTHKGKRTNKARSALSRRHAGKGVILGGGMSGGIQVNIG